jgi:hypothetical protein
VPCRDVIAFVECHRDGCSLQLAAPGSGIG